MSISTAQSELCQVESDDSLHEYGGGHGNKGNDFARFWLINELLKLTLHGEKEYLFILEYVQDVARIDDPVSPSTITLYQLKKKEGGVWDLNTLAGLTAKGKQVKSDSPLAKLLKSILSFKVLTADAEFISNTRYKIELNAGGTALSMDYVSLTELSTERQTHFRDSTAINNSISPNDVPLHKIGLRYAPIEVNDMRVHVIGAAHGMLKQLSVAHAAQADSFVDALFAKLATASRNTSKCKSWEELIDKRGYSKKQFSEALATLQLLPDQQKRREDVLKELAATLRWHTRDEMRIEVALTELARLKLSGCDNSITDPEWAQVKVICDLSESESWPMADEFNAIAAYLRNTRPDESISQVRALAIYVMVQTWTNRIYD